MCLSSVDSKTKHIKTGYKVVLVREKKYGQLTLDSTAPTPEQGYFSECQWSNKPLDVGKWLDEKDYRETVAGKADTSNELLCETQRVIYTKGFHIFVTERAAKVWRTTNRQTLTSCTVKVRVRNCVASGTQRVIIRRYIGKCMPYRVVVAKQIKIVEVLA